MSTNDSRRDDLAVDQARDLTDKLRAAANATDTQADEDARARTLDHPTQLTGAGDYNAAPVGTVMSPPNAAYAYLKIDETTWVTTEQRGRFDSVNVEVDNRGNTTMDVLRWGYGRVGTDNDPAHTDDHREGA